MNRYIGIDAHKASCSVAVMGEKKRIGLTRVETNGQALRDHLSTIPGRKHLCLEESELCNWLVEVLSDKVTELVVVRPPRKRGQPKDDARDAWSLADTLRRGAIEESIYKAPNQRSELRQAVKAHIEAQKDLVRVKLRMGGIFRQNGVLDSQLEYVDCQQRKRWIKMLPASAQRRAWIVGEEIDRLVDIHDFATEWLEETAGRDTNVSRLMTVPAIGLIRAAQIVAIAITPHRFRTTRQFWSYCGLAVVTRSSSDWERDQTRPNGWVRRYNTVKTRGLNRNHQPILKNVFKGAAMTIISHAPDVPLYHGYVRTLQQTKPNLAGLTLARRLAAASLAVWKHKEDYKPEKQQSKSRR